MDLKYEVKKILLEKRMSMTELNNILNKNNNRETTVQNLNTKLTKNTISYKELEEILTILGYNLKWEKRE